MYRKFRFLLIVSCLAVFSQVKAQFNDPMTLEVGPHVGTSYYMGDLNPMYPFAQPRLQYGGLVRFNLNYRWTFRFDYTHATVTASDEVIKWRPERGLNFTSRIDDFSFIAENVVGTASNNNTWPFMSQINHDLALCLIDIVFLNGLIAHK